MENSTQLMTTPWSIYITLLSLGCWVLVIGVLFFTFFKAKPELDEDGTTGHEYDGIREYDKPMPFWWLSLFWISIVFGLVYFFAYPALGNLNGLVKVTNPDGTTVNWTSANEMYAGFDDNRKNFQKFYDKNFAGQDIAQLAANPKAINLGMKVFIQNCAMCHGSNAKGAKGFPNLTDNDWLYGGTPAIIHETIVKGRGGQMPSFQEKLGSEGVKDVAEYVLSLSSKESQLAIDQSRVTRGQAIFDAECAICHGKDAKGMHSTGAPNLTDTIWLFGGTRATVRETLTLGRGEPLRMPAWNSRLTPEQINLVAAFVYSKTAPK